MTPTKTVQGGEYLAYDTAQAEANRLSEMYPEYYFVVTRNQNGGYDIEDLTELKSTC
jgi:hypothetical protein